jgi:hypothetical protein
MTTSAHHPFPPQYVAMLSRDGHGNPPAFAHALSNVFRGIDFRGKHVLEIGSGRGLLAIYIGMQGAAEVLSMEPELVGATSGVIADQRARIETLGLRNVTVVPADFNTWDPGPRRFDVIVSRASINHLYESAEHAEHHQPTWEGYVAVARRIHSMLAPASVEPETRRSELAASSEPRHVDQDFQARGLQRRQRALSRSIPPPGRGASD